MQDHWENEEARLRAVHALGLIGSPEQQRLKRLTRLAQKHFGVPGCNITLIDRDCQVRIVRQGEMQASTPRQESLCSVVVAQRAPLVIADLAQQPENPLWQAVLLKESYRFYAGMPLFSPEGWALGALCLLDHHPRSLTEAELEDLADFAALAEDALLFGQVDQANQELASQIETLRLRAMVDALTGVWNRGAVFDLAHRELSRARRTGTALSLVMLDLDHFKQVNDQHGHLVGDEVLKEVCRRLRACIRSYDAIGRYGGEEFLVVFPDTDANISGALAERLRRAVAERPLTVGDLELDLTISLGLTSTQPSDEEFETVLQRADDALYQAKREGRNRVASR